MRWIRTWTWDLGFENLNLLVEKKKGKEKKDGHRRLKHPRDAIVERRAAARGKRVGPLISRALDGGATSGAGASRQWRQEGQTKASSCECEYVPVKVFA